MSGPIFTETDHAPVNGDTDPARHLLLQKRDGRFLLLLWMNAVSYDTKTKQDMKFQPQPVRIVFAKPILSAKAYLPLDGPDPVALFGSTSEIRVAAPDHVMVLEIEAAGAGER